MAINEVPSRGTDEIETDVRNGIMDELSQSPACKILLPAVTNQGHPSFILGMNDGLFMVTVQRVARASVENMGQGHGG